MLLQGVEKMSQVHGKTTAALLDLYPILRWLPDAFLPERRYAKHLHKESSELYVGHWLDVKKKIKNGTAEAVRLKRYKVLINTVVQWMQILNQGK